MIFESNRAQRLGGAIGVDNVRVEEDLALILNYNCFLQYNIGNDDEFYPSNWKVIGTYSYKVLLSNYKLICRHIFHSVIIQQTRGSPCMLKI